MILKILSNKLPFGQSELVSEIILFHALQTNRKATNSRTINYGYSWQKITNLKIILKTSACNIFCSILTLPDFAGTARVEM
jgi:hypothetical protein